MEHHPIPCLSPRSSDPVPGILRGWLEVLQPCFTALSWEHVLVIVMGAVLAPGKRTITACLRMTGRADAANFASYHQLLNRVRWQSAAMTRRLLNLIVDRLVPDGPVIIGVDDTIERRWGRKIKARGIYRDPVRSSHGHFVKASGLRWLSFMVLTPVPWAMCVKALPVLTILASSERADLQRGRRHKLLTDWARQGMLQLCRWLPGRSIIFIGDSSFAVHELAYAVSGRATLISRLRLDANLFAPPPHRQAHSIGRPAQKGAPLPKLKTLLTRPTTHWHRVTASSWYGRQTGKALDITSDTALWYRRGTPPRPIRWVLVRDPDGKRALKPSSAPTRASSRHKSSPCSFVAGRSRSPSPKPARISVSKPSGNGLTKPSPARSSFGGRGHVRGRQVSMKSPKQQTVQRIVRFA